MFAEFSIILIGLVLGLLGAGGSIMTIPILVYLFKIPPVFATSYSLMIVSFTSLLGVLVYIWNKNINISIAIKFLIPSLISVYLTRSLIVKKIPNQIALCGHIFQKDYMVLFIFAVIMFGAATAMIRNSKNTEVKISQNHVATVTALSGIFLWLQAILIGLLTGIAGAGGGFLIVPTLTLLNKIKIKQAIGSSLLIITVNSLVGLITDLYSGIKIDIDFSIKLIFLSIIGLIIGLIISKYINPNYLKKWFGYFVLITSVFIILKEIFL